MEKVIKLQTEVMPDKNIGVRLSLQILDGDKVGFQHYHCFPPMPPGENLDAWRAAIEANIGDVNSGIPFAPWPAIPDAEWNEVKAVAAMVWTPERVAAQKEKESAAIAAAKAISG